MGIVAAFIIGILFGAWRAHRRGGSRLDMLQYGLAHGMAIAMLALIVTLILARVI